MREIRAKNRALTNRMQAELDKSTDPNALEHLLRSHAAHGIMGKFTVPDALEQHLWEHTFFLTHSVIKSDGMHDRYGGIV